VIPTLMKLPRIISSRCLPLKLRPGLQVFLAAMEWPHINNQEGSGFKV
jgi:hypothetical protein